MNTVITARVETAINLTVTELARVSDLAAAINLLVEKDIFKSLNTVTEFLQLYLAEPTNLGDPKGWHVYQGGHHIALSRIGGTNGETHRVLFVAEGKTPEQTAVILDGIDARVAALIATLGRSEASYAAAYAHAVDTFGLDEALENINYSYGLTVSQRAIVRRQVLLARQKPVTLQGTADALRACTGSVEVTVTDGDQTAVSAAPKACWYCDGPVGADGVCEPCSTGTAADFWGTTQTAPAAAPQAPQATNAAIEAGDAVDVFVNQGAREGWVLAVIGDRFLIEYTMPNGTTALQIHNSTTPRVTAFATAVPVGYKGKTYLDPLGAKSVSYRAVSRKWLEAIVAEGSYWEGKGQGGRGRVTEPSAKALLEASIAKAEARRQQAAFDRERKAFKKALIARHDDADE